MQDPSAGWTDANGKRWFRTTRDAVWACRGLGITAKFVAIRLVEYGADAFPSIATLAEFCEMSERGVRLALRKLEQKRIITTRRTGRSSRYSLFCNVRIPELGGVDDASPPAEGESPKGVSSPGVSPDRHDVPIAPETARSARRADQIGRSCRSDRHVVPPKQGGKQKTKRVVGSARTRAATPQPLFFDFDGWECSPALRAELIGLGIPSERIAYRLRRLKNSPINGGKGCRSLDDYVRDMASEFWVPWEAERRAKANCSGVNAVSSPFGGGAPTSASGLRVGAPTRPRWVTARALKIAEARGIDWKAEAKAFARSYGPGVDGTDTACVASAFALHLSKLKPRREAA
jgi:helix-turn-helix protein